MGGGEEGDVECYVGDWERGVLEGGSEGDVGELERCGDDDGVICVYLGMI